MSFLQAGLPFEGKYVFYHFVKVYLLNWVRNQHRLSCFAYFVRLILFFEENL